MARRDSHPVVGVKELVGPVELLVPGDERVHQQERDLRVAKLVERPEAGRRSPCGGAAEARRPQVADHRREFGQRQRGVVELDQLNPSGVEVVEQAGLAKRRAHTEDRRVLLPLIRELILR